MVVRLKLTLEQDEYAALLKLAISEERNPEGQLRYILRRELLGRKLLSEDVTPDSSKPQSEAQDA